MNLRLAPAPETPEATQKLRTTLAPQAVALVALCLLAAIGVRWWSAWVRHGTVWTSAGTVEPDANGGASGRADPRCR